MKYIFIYQLGLLILILTGWNSVALGQLESPGRPIGSYRTLQAADAIYMLPPLHPLQKEAMMQENTESYAKPGVFAMERALSISTTGQGVWTREEGHRVWRAHIISPGAVSLGLIFDQYALEEGVKVVVYDPDQRFVKGAYTSLNNKTSGLLAIGHVPGEEVIVELQVPAHMTNFGSLSLGSLSHAFLPIALNGTLDGRFGRSQDCELDISCPEGAPWQLEKKSVVRVHTTTQYCTGVLLNNTAYDGDPLLLTAEHCIENSYRAESSIFVFNYESSSCFGPDGSVDMSISGSELLSTGDSIDYSLVRLSLTPPESFDVYYAGWDLTDSPPGPSTTIHHPEGDVKKISFDNEAPEATVDASQIPPQFWDLLSHSFWWIKQWDVGTTEPGSSGSPLFTPQGQVIGILSFGSARCGDSIGYDAETDRVIFSKEENKDDYYTRLSVAWDYHSDSAKSLKPWLDATASGVRSLEGLHPGAAGKERTADGSDFSLWPNPSTGKLWFSTQNPGEILTHYRIFDIRGALILENQAFLPGPVEVDVGGLPGGLYFLEIAHEADREVLKFMILQ